MRQGGECGWSAVAKVRVMQGEVRAGEVRAVAVGLTGHGLAAHGKEFGFILRAKGKLSKSSMAGELKYLICIFKRALWRWRENGCWGLGKNGSR